MMTTTCRQCGREFTLDRQAILAGQWRRCPSCRHSPPTADTGDLPARPAHHDQSQSQVKGAAA